MIFERGFAYNAAAGALAAGTMTISLPLPPVDNAGHRVQWRIKKVVACAVDKANAATVQCYLQLEVQTKNGTAIKMAPIGGTSGPSVGSIELDFDGGVLSPELQPDPAPSWDDSTIAISLRRGDTSALVGLDELKVFIWCVTETIVQPPTT